MAKKLCLPAAAIAILAFTVAASAGAKETGLTQAKGVLVPVGEILTGQSVKGAKPEAATVKFVTKASTVTCDPAVAERVLKVEAEIKVDTLAEVMAEQANALKAFARCPISSGGSVFIENVKLESLSTKGVTKAAGVATGVVTFSATVNVGELCKYKGTVEATFNGNEDARGGHIVEIVNQPLKIQAGLCEGATFSGAFAITQKENVVPVYVMAE